MCVHELVEAQVSRTPDAVAVISADGQLSYMELNAAANRLAHQLRALGVGPESVVGVCLHRGLDMVITLLGVLKAGGAYLPLDPDYPADRLAFMLADSGARVVITGRELRAALGDHTADVVLSDTDRSGMPDHDPDSGVDGSNPAYVMYTSGSTGRPKGVVVPHRGVVNRLLWGLDTYPLDATDRVLQKTPYSFDVSVPEFFCPLAAGATLVMARPGGHRDPAYLVELIGTRRITSVHFVPSMLRPFLAEPFADLPSLRRMFCSGEALTADLVDAVRTRLRCELHNLYGPTEASVEVTAIECHPGQPVTIGRPIANTQTHILDADLRPLPDGAAGELMLSGVQLARGYHDNPGLTAERFIPSPFGGPGERQYRTGDLARRNPDGTITYLGRLDSQVKIRGNRVELGEIEAVLATHPDLGGAVIGVHDGGTGPQLVAYLVAGRTRRPAVGELREFLHRTLPEYMVPTRWVELAEVPLTASGKVDRKALPAPDAAPEWGAATDHVPPSTPVEHAIAEVWAEVLGVNGIGAHDDFFDRGGHSLLATQVVALLSERFPVDLPVSAVFDAPTVAGLAKLVHRAISEYIAQLPESELDTMLAEVRDR